MEIPLKSKAKVSVVNHVDDSNFVLKPTEKVDQQITNLLVQPVPTLAVLSKNPIERVKRDTFPEFRTTDSDSSNPAAGMGLSNYKLTRTYSETETNNFDLETGHRLYDDGKIRPSISRANSRSPDKFGRHRNFSESIGPQDSLAPRYYSRSQNAYEDEIEMMGTVGLEDEYIPGLDFANMVYQWNQASASDVDLSKGNLKKSSDDYKSTNTSSSNTPLSRDVSYLDLNLLHSQVAPQPIKRQQSFSRLSFTKLNDFMKLRHPNNNSSATTTAPGAVPLNHKSCNNGSGLTTGNAVTHMEGSETITSPNDNADSATTLSGIDPLTKELDSDHKIKRQKLVVKPDGGVNYEFILNSLPSNFNDLPYSQRKKIIKSYSESIDYSQFSLIAKQYYTDKFSSSSGGSSGKFGSFSQRRSRRNSANTVAGRLLALSSAVDLQKLSSSAEGSDLPKENVDEKGALVLNHELGKVIGFGAWGTIRECKNIKTGDIRACKIVKATRNDIGSSHSSGSTPGSGRKVGASILRVFKKEIEIWNTLHHPNILPLFEHLETDNATFCITNRIFGGTLFEIVSSWGVFNAEVNNTHGPIGFLVESQRDRILKTAGCALQIVEALLYMHQDMGIVHGDIKLENILVDNKKMILCDFGMSRVYSTRLSRKNSLRFSGTTPLKKSDLKLSVSSEQMLRSKSSSTNTRRPLNSSDSLNTRFLFKDDSKIGISHFARTHGPSLQSLDLTPTQSLIWGDLKEQQEKENANAKKRDGIESELPHLHIGSLPYASPELLLPCPPPLGPSADIWAFGILMYTMIVGKLPFQHPYEPRLRAFISAGKYNKDDLKMACLIKCVISDDTNSNLSLQDLQRLEDIEILKKSWEAYDKSEFKWIYDIITGCLEKNITKRYDLDMIYNALRDNYQLVESNT